MPAIINTSFLFFFTQITAELVYVDFFPFFCSAYAKWSLIRVLWRFLLLILSEKKSVEEIFLRVRVHGCELIEILQLLFNILI